MLADCNHHLLSCRLKNVETVVVPRRAAVIPSQFVVIIAVVVLQRYILRAFMAFEASLLILFIFIRTRPSSASSSVTWSRLPLLGTSQRLPCMMNMRCPRCTSRCSTVSLVPFTCTSFVFVPSKDVAIVRLLRDSTLIRTPRRDLRLLPLPPSRITAVVRILSLLNKPI